MSRVRYSQRRAAGSAENVRAVALLPLDGGESCDAGDLCQLSMVFAQQLNYARIRTVVQACTRTHSL